MKPLLHILFLLLAFTAGARPHTYDVVIVGGTPAGITAAVAAAREGKNSVILERSDHVGGLPVNGLGATDIATRGATAGLFARFVVLNKAHYTEKYGADSQQVRDCSDGYHFEPSVAAETFARMLAEAGPGRITVLTGRQFDAEARYVEKRGDRIVSAKSTTAARYSSTPPTKATWAPPPEFRSGPDAKEPPNTANRAPEKSTAGGNTVPTPTARPTRATTPSKPTTTASA